VNRISANEHTLPPKISVITIVRNGLPFLEKTIESVLGQQYRNLEYIVIDGGSTDGTVDIIKSHESRITRWVSEKDDGIAHAFNKGLSFATGDYILFLNSDDALVNMHILEEVAEKIVENNFPTLIYGDCNVLDRNTDELVYRTAINFSREGLRFGRMLPHPSLFTNRRYFDEYGEFDTQFKVAMDYEWLLRGGHHEQIIHTSLLVTNVRTGGVSTLDRSQVVTEILLALKKNEYIPSRWAELKVQLYFFTRSHIKAILKGIGLYKILEHHRKKRASTPINGKLENDIQDKK